MSLLQRLGGFTGLQVLSALSPLLLMPIVARSVSPAGWADLATAQAVGGLGATVILFGWSLSGQARVALASTWEERQELYRASLASRRLVALVIVPTSAMVTGLICRSELSGTAVLMAIAMTSVGMSSAWFSVGIGKASWLARFDVVPRAVAVAISGGLLILHNPVWVYPTTLIIASTTGLLSSNRKILGQWVPMIRSGRWYTAFTALDPRAALANILGTVYASSPLPVATLAAGAADVSGMASIDKLYRYGLLAVSSLGNSLQEWAVGADSRVRGRRTQFSILMHTMLGLLGGLGLAVAGPPVSALLFGAPLRADYLVCGLYGAAYLSVSMSTPLIRNVLIPAHRSGAVLVATSTTAGVGIGIMVVAARFWGANGVALGLAVSELLCLLVLALQARSHHSQTRQQHHAVANRTKKWTRQSGKMNR